MATQQNDALLTAGKVMTIFLMGLTLVVTVLLVGLIPTTLIWPDLLFDDGSFSAATSAAVVAILVLAAAVTAGAFYFFRLLGQMIKSVSEGNPFSIENSQRLSRMGWIALVFQFAAFPITGLAAYLAHHVPSENLTIDYEFSLTGLLLAIVLFILARVFKQGAEMREDLEGTV